MTSRRLSTRRLAAASVVLAAVLLHGPLFLRSPLGPDPVMYDLQAQLVERGGVLYRDLLEPNLPGAVWVHLIVRSVAGWSAEALRAFDLAWFMVTAVLAARLMSNNGRNRAMLIALMLTGYTTVSEWCHCQRDAWMLPFVLGAVLLRIRRLDGSRSSERNLESRSSRVPLPQAWQPLVFALLEGMLWGGAVWLKPHVVLPAALVVAASWLRHSRDARLRFIDEMTVIVGGAAVGALGAWWLVGHDAWQPLWKMLTEWNGDYVAASSSRRSWERLWSIQQRLAPWSLIHVAAVPVAVWILSRARRRSTSASIVAALYLGWLAQTLLLQHLFDYIHLPAIVLGAIVLSMLPWRQFSVHRNPVPFAATAAAVLMAALASRAGQLSLWPECIAGSSSPHLKSALARLPLPRWETLANVERFLRSQGVKDGELTTYHTHTIHLYPALAVSPSTRFAFTETHLRLFPARAAEIATALAQSRQKFVVSDLLEAGLDPSVALDDSDRDNWRRACPSSGLTAFPFDQPVVFRSGPYLVHSVTGFVGPMETRFFPLAAKTAGL